MAHRQFKQHATKVAAAIVAISVAGSAAVFAQATPPIPVRSLSPAAARTPMPLAAVAVRELPGRVLLVNDTRARRLYLFDSTLTSFRVLRDSLDGRTDSYGPRAASIVPYLGDSTLFADNSSQTLVVIDPRGAFGRVMAPPDSRSMTFLSAIGTGVDARGRLVYQGVYMRSLGAFPTDGTPLIMQPVDSAPVLRGDFDARRIDTLTRVKLARGPQMSMTRIGDQMRTSYIVNPLTFSDGWTTVADGSIAIVRGHDYHIDWFNPDGSTTSSPKMAFDWRRLTDDDKQKMVDSARHVKDIADALDAIEAGVARGMGVCYRIEAGRDVSYACPLPETTYAPLAEIADYYPPIRANAVRADLDNNVWILPTTSLQNIDGSLVYDVVNRRGEIFERVRVPPQRTIAGFGRGGVVYLLDREADGLFIERARIQR